jgi:hapalindole biogenesis HpiC1 cyclase-like protein/PEP-CTERM motif-containing protein
MRLRPGIIFALVLCFGVAGSAAWADGVPVENASFETTNALTSSCGTGCAYNTGPIPDWTTAGPGLAGSWQPSSTYLNVPLPNGNIVAYSNGGTISQILGVTVQPDSTYTLSVYVGDRLDGYVANYSIALDDGSTTLCSTPTASNGAITPGTFADVTLTCSTGTTVTPGDLAIVLTSGGPQIDFDNVALNVVQTPEPASYLLLCIGLGSMFVFFRYRRTEVSS